MNNQFTQTPRTTVHRGSQRASHDRELIESIIDEALYCTVASIRDSMPHCQPMIHSRDGNEIILHGNPENRLLKDLAEGAEICLNICILDGIRMGKTIPMHSFDYRSVNVYGYAKEVTDPEEKMARMRKVFDGLTPNRWESLPTLPLSYLDHTRTFVMPLEECVAKVNRGPIEEAGPDKSPIWHGVIPVHLSTGVPRSGKDATGKPQPYKPNKKGRI